MLQIMHIRAYQFPESKIQKFKKFNAEFRIEKKKHLLIDWAFFTDIEIICQIKSKPEISSISDCDWFLAWKSYH